MNNGYFKLSDPSINRLDNFDIPVTWWSRGYEYAWALHYAGPGLIVADMGTGWTYRPLRYALADACEMTYAVDTDHRVLDQPQGDGLKILTGNFSYPIDGIEPGSLDRVFCVSVLEDCGTGVGRALYQFAQLIGPDGRVVITMDSQFDMARPFPILYPGVNMPDFLESVKLAGLVFDGPVDFDKTGAVVHDEWNLAVFHCVLRREQ